MTTKRSQWAEQRPPEDYFRLLDPRAPAGEIPSPVPDVELVRWYRTLILTRALERFCVRMQRRGEISVAADTLGEEAAGLGAAAALRAGDWCFPSYRQTSALLHWGAPLDRIVAGLAGFPPEHIDKHLPVASAPQVNLLPYTIFLGASIPHAVGCALADQLNRRDIVTLAFIGEGATSEGDFYEGLNFASVFKVPLVVVIQNNQWSISVPAHRQTAARTFAAKAEAVGMSGFRVDGNDLIAMYQITKECVDRARGGGGPSLIEAVTYRMGDHNSADAAAVYRGPEEVEYWRALDPVDRFERYLSGKGLLNDGSRAAILAEAEGLVREAIARARQVPQAAPDLMFANHLGGAESWAAHRQRLELSAELGGRNPFDDEEYRLPR